MKCTWKNCENEGQHSMTDKGGAEWALLCDSHNSEFNEAVSSGEPKKILRCWVKASGGADRLAKRI